MGGPSTHAGTRTRTRTRTKFPTEPSSRSIFRFVYLIHDDIPHCNFLLSKGRDQPLGLCHGQLCGDCHHAKLGLLLVLVKPVT